MVAFGRPLYRAGMISRWLVVRALWSQLIFEHRGADEERMRKFRESALRITRGWDQARISAIVRDTLTEVIDPIVYDEALDLIRQHQARRPARVPRVGLTRGDRRAPRALPGRRRGHRQPGRARRVGPLHGRGRVLQLRSVQGRCHAPRGGRARHRPRRVLRLLRLGHRPPDARGGRPSVRRQPRPRPGPDRVRAGLGGAAVPPRRPAARARRDATAATDRHRRRRDGHRRRSGRRRLVAVAQPRQGRRAVDERINCAPPPAGSATGVRPVGFGLRRPAASSPRTRRGPTRRRGPGASSWR